MNPTAPLVATDPDLLTPEIRARAYPGREHRIRHLAQVVFEQKPDSASQHLLVHGRPGTGKCLVANRVCDQVEKHPQWRVVRLARARRPETTPDQLWLHVMRGLGSQTPFAALTAASRRIEAAHENTDDRTAYAVSALEGALRDHPVQVLVLVQRLDRVLQGFAHERYAWALRKTLSEFFPVTFLGTAAELKPFVDYDQAFYGYFGVYGLNPLTWKETRTAFAAWNGQAPTAPQTRVLERHFEASHGHPRRLLTAFGFVVHEHDTTKG